MSSLAVPLYQVFIVTLSLKYVVIEQCRIFSIIKKMLYYGVLWKQPLHRDEIFQFTVVILSLAVQLPLRGKHVLITR